MVKDTFLGILVSMAERGSQIPIMLNVGGKVIGGEMIGQREYFEETGRSMPNDPPWLQRVFAGIPDTFDEAVTKHVEEGADPEVTEEVKREMAESFVHLKNVYLFSDNGTTVNMHGALWRGRSEAVSGFWLGTPSRDG